jgi:mannosyltransferase OCH1-like enzyme
LIPKIIHQTSKTKDLSWEEGRMVNRIRRMLPDWQHHLWDDEDNAALMARAFPQFLDRYNAIRFGVAKADVARCAYMHAYGGFYFDTDYKLLREPDEALRSKRCVVPLEQGRPAPSGSSPGHQELGNAALASEPGHPFWRAFIEFIFDEKEAHHITDPQEIIPATGPVAVTEFYRARRADYPEVYLPRANDFHPDISLFALRSSADRESYGIHLHWGSWRGRPVYVAARTLLRRKINGLLS